MTTTAAPSFVSLTPAGRVASATLTPTAPEERIQTLDVLRGFALFGVLWSNLNAWYGTTAPATSLDRALSWTQGWLIGGRFYTLLGFLFGLGFAMQLARAESRGREVSVPYLRRMVVLLAIGFVHGLLIWRGDILTLYATLGFALLLYRGLSPRGLLIAAAVTFWMVPPVRAAILVHFHLVQVPSLDYSVVEFVYAHGTIAQVFEMRARDFLDKFSRILFGGFPNFLALFVLGLWVGRMGIVQRLPERLPAIRKTLLVSVGCCIVGLVVQHNFAQWWPRPPGPAESLTEFVGRIPRGQTNLIVAQLPVWSMAAVYACALTLLAHRKGWPRRLASLAAAGRIPLTTYLTQSVVCTLLFYSYGLGWYGHVDFTGMLVITLVLFSLQMMASSWWLARYRFGPVEWLWRSLSYGTMPPNRPR